MAVGAAPRTYHSVAVLLHDGSVFSGGGGLCGKCDNNHFNGQIWRPPYLFNADDTPATRPTITVDKTIVGAHPQLHDTNFRAARRRVICCTQLTELQSDARVGHAALA